MKEEDLVKKLESTRLPEAGLPNHESHLKTALLKRYNSASDRRAFAGKGRVPVVSTIKGFLTSYRPVLKKALVSASVAAVIFIVCLAVTMSPLVRDYETMAMEIALNDPKSRR